MDKVCTDKFNYDESTGKFCPMAVALGYHEYLTETNRPTDHYIFKKLQKRFAMVNILKGIPGEFYHGSHEQRLKDLNMVVEEIINSRA